MKNSCGKDTEDFPEATAQKSFARHGLALQRLELRIAGARLEVEAVTKNHFRDQMVRGSRYTYTEPEIDLPFG